MKAMNACNTETESYFEMGLRIMFRRVDGIEVGTGTYSIVG
jgi:hypothetical protein